MKKTLMALAVGAAFAAPSAFADVTISGSINMDLEVLKVGDASAAGTTNSIVNLSWSKLAEQHRCSDQLQQRHHQLDR